MAVDWGRPEEGSKDDLEGGLLEHFEDLDGAVLAG